MEKIFRTRTAPRPTPAAPPSALNDRGQWRHALPVLSSGTVLLREADPADAATLLMAIGTSDLSHLGELAPSPTMQGLQGLLTDLPRLRATGAAACWAIVPRGLDVPVGLILIRGLDPGFTLVEGTALLGDEYRGTGLFAEAARLTLDCLFEVMRVHRLEVRVDAGHGRANGAMRKVGAAQEGVLRQARCRDGVFRDHVLWAVIAEDWALRQDVDRPSVH